MIRLAVICSFFLLNINFAFGQISSLDTLDNVQLDLEEGEPTIELNPGSAEKKKKEEKKKKVKKNVFWDIKAKKCFIKSKKGNTITFQQFYILPEYEDPDAYPWEKYYYDHKERKIKKARVASDTYGLPLHGSYARFVNGEVIERGYFYKGVKHGRWEKYRAQSEGLLMDKQNWNMGFPKESEITRYPHDTRALKEVVPMRFGKKEGRYISFYENGNVKETGEYLDNRKIKIWTEYFDAFNSKGRQQVQRQTQQRKQKELYAESFEPKLLREYNENGERIGGEPEEKKTRRGRRGRGND